MSIDFSADQFEALFRQVSNWGRWGEGDQRGALHHLTPDHVVAAARLVRSGLSVTLSRPLPTEAGVSTPAPADHHMTMLTDTDIGSGSLRFAKDYVGGDYHNDGKIDVLIGNCNEAPALLKNNAGAGNQWIGVHLQGTKCNRDAIGAKLTWSADGAVRSRLKTSGGSYLSSHDPREVLGLGKASKLDWIEIRWPGPSGLIERFSGLQLGKYHRVVEGSGERQRP